MNQASRPPRITVTTRRYRWADRVSKLLGVVLIAAGLHLGGGTIGGLTLALVGVAFGLLTVFLDSQ